MHSNKNVVRKVLILSTIGIGLEGMTSVIYNYASNISCNGVELHFVAYAGDNPQLIEKFKRIGPVHILPERASDPWNYLQELRELLKRGFDTIHIHGNSGTMILDVLCARLAGVSQIITHGHCTVGEHPFVHKITRYPMAALAAHRFACSHGAGKWLYGACSYRVISNAINIENYRYQKEACDTAREELSIGSDFLIGHVGYFDISKNQTFLVDVFHEFHQKIPNSKLLLIGDGDLRENVEQKIANLGLQDCVILTGRRMDVNRLYSAMDIFVMPSMDEGLPLCLLEAQANALPVLAADTITQEVKCLDRMYYLSLEDGPERWAEKIEQIYQMQYDRSIDPTPNLREKGFDIHYEAGTLEKIYLGEKNL